MTKRKYIISIMGPTGVGKTELAIELSKLLNSFLISVDSVQVYKGLNIGSGKLSKEELLEYPHKLIDISDPIIPYSVAKFNKDVWEVINEIHLKNKVPILVGGTMLYFNSLIKGLTSLPNADSKLRKELTEKARLKGWPKMHQELSKIDPQAAAKIHMNDSQRIQRALEINLLTGLTINKLKDKESISPNSDLKLLQFAIQPNSRESLRSSLEQRFLGMLDNGFIEEVEQLIKARGMIKDLPSMRSVGYRQIWEYLDGNLSNQEMILRSINATRQLAKRQMTWLRSWEGIIWLPQFIPDAVQLILQTLDEKDLI